MTTADWWLAGGGLELLGTIICARWLYDGKRGREWTEWDGVDIAKCLACGLIWFTLLAMILIMAAVAWSPKASEEEEA